MSQSDWMKDPLVANIDKNKLEFLQLLVFESKNLSREQMMPFLMSVAGKGKANNISFSDSEVETIVTVLRKYSSSEEVDKINKIMKMRKK